MSQINITARCFRYTLGVQVLTLDLANASNTRPPNMNIIKKTDESKNVARRFAIRISPEVHRPSGQG
jgi:hypothetical protein